MNKAICSRCKKNIAVVFITKIENGVTSNEGICMSCAKDLGIQPMADLMKQMGMSEDDFQSMTNEIMESLDETQDMMSLMTDDARDDGTLDDEGKTATFPFLGRLFGNSEGPLSPPILSGGEGGRQPRESERRGNNNNENAPKHKFLENYCISLTKKAKNGKLDRVVGRETEIRRVIQILNRRQKNNPCLIGEPGVGKTAIAEGLAQRIADGDAPYKLLNKEVYLLDLTALVAGTQFRGQFESRMKGLIEDIRKLGNIVLVIDEVHNLVGAGDAEGSMNAANILKPALSRGEIQVIGATTFAEYRKHIEKDAALERRFQPVTVNEPSLDEAVEILGGIAKYYEQFHGVRITPETIRQAVYLSERYITDRFLPDKAIDLIDEACSDLNLKNPDICEREAIRNELGTIQTEREQLSANNKDTDYERLAILRSREMQINTRLEELSEREIPALGVDSLATVIEQWTKIPASKIQEQEFGRLSQLDQRLKERIIGQDNAVQSVANAVRRGRAGVSAKRKPISFIFTGPTGVGKTELVKSLAADLFDTPDSLIRLDMSEFMEKHAVARIIGSPPGYVGYDEAGQLTEKVRRKPYCVVLFDEIEKAHPDVMNVLLQILDDGHITDGHGRKVNFENTVIVMTSNAGSDKGAAPLGFGKDVNQMSGEKAMKALQDFLRPEFINRVDEVISFNQLNEEDFASIAKLMLSELADNLKERGILFIWDEEMEKILVKKAFSIKYGARNLRRTIQKEIEDKIASLLIDGYKTPPTHIKAVGQDDEIKVLSL